MRITVFLGEITPVIMKGLAAQLQNFKNLSIITSLESSLPTLDFLSPRQPDFFIYDIDHNGEKNGFPLLCEVRNRCGNRRMILPMF